MKNSNINVIYIKIVNLNKLDLIIGFDNFVIKKLELIIL